MELALGIRRRLPLRARHLQTMQTRHVELTNRYGLHARACAKIVEVASRFRCSISLVCKGRRASARSMLAVMLLAASVGATIRVETSGPDEAEAMKAMVQLIADQFGEER